MAKIGKILKTGILAAAAAAGTYYIVKNKDELLQRAKDFAEKLSENTEEPDLEVEFDFTDDFEEVVAESENVEETAASEETAD